MSHINNGSPTNIWHGITAGALRAHCAKATTEQAESMAYVAALMDAREPITQYDWNLAESAYRGVRSVSVKS